MKPPSLYAFFDELEKIGQVESEVRARAMRRERPEAGGGTLEPPRALSERTSPRMDVPRPEIPNEALIKALQARENVTMPTPEPPMMEPPKPPIGERIKSLARRGGAVLKGIEKIVSQPMAPHRYAGVAYRRDYSGFKYS